MEKIVFFTQPLLIILFTIALILALLDFFIKKFSFVFKISFGLVVVALTIFAILFGAGYQETIIAILVLLVFELFTFYGFKKEEKNK